MAHVKERRDCMRHAGPSSHEVAVACLCLYLHGVGEQLRGHRDADAPLGEWRPAVLPFLARQRLQPLPRLPGTPAEDRSRWASRRPQGPTVHGPPDPPNSRAMAPRALA